MGRSDPNDVKTEQWFENYLHELLEEIVPSEVQEKIDVESPDTVRTFKDVGVLTNNHGLVVKFKGGSEFHLRIIKSK